MSELTQCNHCSLLDIRARAQSKGYDVTLSNEDSGVTVYVHPRGHTPEKGNDPSTGNPRSPYFASWFMELTDHCCC